MEPKLRDTICAISTPAGIGGIAVARISGPKSFEVVSCIWRGKPLQDCQSHSAHLGWVLDSEGNELDQAVATIFRGPNSFTGEDVVELSVHGSQFVQQELLHSLTENGARLAECGEFTRRAFTNGNFDLAQAEAVADVIASTDRASHRLALTQMRGQFSSRLKLLRNQLMDLASLLELELDFSEEDVEFASRDKLKALAIQILEEVNRLAKSFRQGQAIKNGIPVAIVGATNAGKSSLLNALLDDDRAIVSDIHGTTRDVVEDTMKLGEYTFRMMDTAGLRHTSDAIEAIGIERSNLAAQRAHILLCVFDSNSPAKIALPETEAFPIVVINKSDLESSPELKECISQSGLSKYPIVYVSAKQNQGIEELQHLMVEAVKDASPTQSVILVTNQRHYEALRNASESITSAIAALDSSLSGDLIAQDIRLTIHHLSSILGDIPSSDLLATIFSRFCIGK